MMDGSMDGHVVEMILKPEELLLLNIDELA